MSYSPVPFVKLLKIRNLWRQKIRTGLSVKIREL
jgi:hypothetical protein